MAKKGKSKFKKSGIPLEVESSILGMNPTDLAVEVTFERNAIEFLKKDIADGTDFQKLKETLKQFDDELAAAPDVLEAKTNLDLAKEKNTSDEHVQAKEDVAIWKKSHEDADIKDRKKKLKFMEKTLARHIESGALKRKNP